MSSQCCSCNCSEKSIDAPITVDSHFGIKEHWEHISFRLGIKRMERIISPGLYKIGNPSANSEIFVSCNFKISFDHLRKYLVGIDAWILVIDTNGINVWCAAGKGTFGTTEIISRIKLTNVKEKVNHKRIIVPQLGAPGISAHVVERETGFKVVYGPVEASDIKKFLDNNLKADEKMRTVFFPIVRRAILIPLEIVSALKTIALFSLVLFLLGTLDLYPFSFNVNISSFYLVIGFFMSIFAGSVFVQLALPFIFFRAFVLKGYLVGVIFQALFIFLFFNNLNMIEIVGTSLLFPSISAYLAFNFTGCTTFTSQSGVEREMKIFLRPMRVLIVVGGILTILGGLVRL